MNALLKLCLAAWGGLILAAGASVGQGLVVTSAGAYGETAAPGAAAIAFGSELASEAAVGPVGRGLMLPTELAGATVEVDGRRASLAYVSAGQINFIVPRLTAEGTVEVIVRSEGRVTGAGSMRVARTAPEIFSADGSGAGPGLAFNSATFEAEPFPSHTPELPGCDKRTRLTLLGSGIRGADPDEVQVTLGTETGMSFDAAVERTGASETYPGVDEVRFVLPEEVAEEGTLSVRLVADGVESNAVTLAVQAAEAPALDCSAYGLAVVHSTVADLLAGDLWDVTQPASVFAGLDSAPEEWEVAGVGTTALEARNGEVIGTGSAGAPELVWSDPEFPPTVRTLEDEPIPFVALAAGNPASVVTAQAEPGVPIHQQIVELARENGLAFAAIRVSGRFGPVSYSVAHNLLKQGTPLTDPAVDKAPFQLFFEVEEGEEWEFSGFYGAAPSIQEVVSVRGAPVHLHGFRIDRSRAGHIGSATVENAEIRLYPLAPPTVRDADLTLRDVVVADGRASFEALNSGEGVVSRTTVQGRVGERVLFQTELSDMRSGEPRPIAVDLPEDASLEDLEVIIDPFNDVFESDESNNVWIAR